MAQQHTLSLTNQEVAEFYSKYGLDFEQMNLIIVNLLKKLMTDTDSSLNSGFGTHLLHELSALTTKVDSITSTLGKNYDDVAMVFQHQIMLFRKEYMEDLKSVFLINNAEHVGPLLRELNSGFLDKTTLLLHEILPREHDSFSKTIVAQMDAFQFLLVEKTNQLLATTLDKHTMDEFKTSVSNTLGEFKHIADSKFDSVLLGTETRIDTRIASSESRIQTHMAFTDAKISQLLQETHDSFTEIKSISVQEQSANKLVHSNMADILKKFANGSSKGTLSENVLNDILLGLFPSADIQNVAQEKETGDIILVRDGRPKILIENKDHETKNVTKLEVDKFIRDCDIQDCCGIMFAQHRGISNKSNFELQIHKTCVLLYVHAAKFDPDKIRIAIEIVEHFKMKLDELHIGPDDGAYEIEKEVLHEINRDFGAFATQKLALLKLAKDQFEKLTATIADFKIPALEKYLSTRFAFSAANPTTNNNLCTFCKKLVTKSMPQHHRYCIERKRSLQEGKGNEGGGTGNEQEQEKEQEQGQEKGSEEQYPVPPFVPHFQPFQSVQSVQMDQDQTEEQLLPPSLTPSSTSSYSSYSSSPKAKKAKLTKK